MKPIKGLAVFAAWGLRSALLFSLYIMFWPEVNNWSFDNMNYFIALGFLLSGIVLFISGFTKKSSGTIISSLVIAILMGYQIFVNWNGIGELAAIWIFILASSLYFVANGNKS